MDGGEILGLLGRNGAGKTTIIRMMLDLIPKGGGEILWHGKPLSKQNVKIGYLPEERGLYPKMNVLDQIIYFGMLEGLSRKQARKEGKKWLEKLKISDLCKNRTEQLSKGNQQKIQLITALIHDPEFIILDEPFSGLDPVNGEMLKDVVKQLIAQKKTIIFCSHQMEQVESFCEQVCILKDGNIIVSDELANVKTAYPYRYIQVQTDEQLSLEPTLKDFEFTKEHNHYQIKIPREYDAFPFMQSLNATYRLQELSLKEPSLHEIFIERTGDELNA